MQTPLLLGDQETISLFQNILVCFNSKDTDTYRNLHAEDMEFRDMSSPSLVVNGRQGFVEGILSWWKAFPDATVTCNSMIASGGAVALEGTMTGTHKGAFRDIPPTDRKIDYRFMEIAQFEDGKLKTLRIYRDMATVYEQLGVNPMIE